MVPYLHSASASVTEVVHGGIPAVHADNGLRMTLVPIALAPRALGEVPVAWRACVAVLTKDWLERKKTSSLPFASFKSSRCSREL